MKLSQVPELPTTLDAAQVAELLGVSTWSIYQAVKSGTSPVPAIRIGRRVVFSTAAALRAIGIEPTPRDHDEPGGQR